MGSSSTCKLSIGGGVSKPRGTHPMARVNKAPTHPKQPRRRPSAAYMDAPPALLPMARPCCEHLHHSAPPARPTPTAAQTYQIPQATGPYRYIMGGGTLVSGGAFFDDEEPNGAGMTRAQVRPGACVTLQLHKQPASGQQPAPPAGADQLPSRVWLTPVWALFARMTALCTA